MILSSGPFLVGHAEHPDGSRADDTAGKRRLLDQHESVERITVLPERPVDETVVSGVAGRGEQHPVEVDPARDVVHLVLVALAFRDLYDDFEFHWHLQVGAACPLVKADVISPRRRMRARRSASSSSRQAAPPDLALRQPPSGPARAALRGRDRGSRLTCDDPPAARSHGCRPAS